MPTAPRKIPVCLGPADDDINRAEFRDLVDFGNKHCERKIHSHVVKWLREPCFSKVGGGEASLHSIYDPLFMVMTEILGGRLIRDSHDSHSTSGLRPDVIIDISVPIFRAEEKKDEKDLPIAAKELTEKLQDVPLAVLGPMPYFFAAAIAGTRIQFYVLKDGESTSLSLQLDVSDDGSRVDALRIVINMCRCILPQMGTLATQWKCPLPLDGEKKRSPTRGGHVKISGMKFVEKDYAKAMPNLVSFYKATADVAGIEHVHKITEENSKFTLYPICVEPQGEYKEAAASQIAKTLAKVHETGWCHMDVRWPNIMFDCKEGKYILIDCEFATKNGDPVPSDLRSNLNPLNLVTASPPFDHVSFWQLLNHGKCPDTTSAEALFNTYVLKPQ
jgi:hypothetical protein